MATRTEPLVVRPNRATYRAHRASGPGAALIGLSIVVQLGKAGVVGLIVGIVATIAAVYGAHRYMNSVRVEVADSGVTYAGILRTRRWPWSEVGRLLVVERLVNDPLLKHEFEWLIGLDRRGRRMFQLTSGVWADADRARLADTFPTVERLPEETSGEELHKRHPGALNWAQRHQLATGLIASVVILSVTTVTVYLVVGPG